MSAATQKQTDAPMPASDGLTLIASFMLGAAGLAHLSAAPAHFGEWWVFGSLFSLAAGLQFALAVALLLRPSRTLLDAASAISLGLIATWILSRTSGLPFGPESGEREAVGLLDVLTTLEELVLVACLGVALLGPLGGRSRRLLLTCEASGVALGILLTLAFAGGVGHG